MAAVLRSRNHRAQSCHLQDSILLVLRFAFLYFFIFRQKADQGNGKCQSHRSQVIGGGLLIEQFASWVGHLVKSSQVTALDTNTKKLSFWCLARVVLGSVL